MNIGIIGCGAISGIYLENLSKSARVRVTAVADLDLSRAKAAAARYGARAVSVDELLGADDVDLVLNLTTPDAHEVLARRAVESGKHVYNEKPLCIDPKAARDLLELARRKNVRVGCAPDTVLGAGIQTSRKLVADGAIGDPVGGLAFMLCPGHESWHPDPAFYYKKGGGPVLDMGPYYITALVTILGPVTGVRSVARKTRTQRTITSQPRHGQKIDVEVATHCVGILEFASGASVSATLSFDVHRSRCSNIEIWGTGGALAVPDPNGFGGPVSIFKPGENDWSEAALVDAPSHNARGLGVEDMAGAIAEGRPHRASGALALHVLDVMTAMATGATAKIESPQ
ncbi:MAG: gfo/Idh/MocA family oxidoreductase [Leptolyngbya sp. PLA3]|nr:MAG: gfo/Idh/MocA family oxidoreductase [Cyanobacteria bacterium CYA]MCE7969813.1 gfo/Idh/MocA family oxidoreductase [Leptolyngbya sp. PL-A3]